MLKGVIPVRLEENQMYMPYLFPLWSSFQKTINLDLGHLEITLKCVS